MLRYLCPYELTLIRFGSFLLVHFLNFSNRLPIGLVTIYSNYSHFLWFFKLFLVLYLYTMLHVYKYVFDLIMTSLFCIACFFKSLNHSNCWVWYWVSIILCSTGDNTPGDLTYKTFSRIASRRNQVCSSYFYLTTESAIQMLAIPGEKVKDDKQRNGLHKCLF